MTNTRLGGKAAIVVGAGASAPGWSIGRAVAVLFARAGARVLAVDLDERQAVETRDIIRGEGGTCEAIRADATVLADMEAAVATCRQAFGRVDILHNNVGRGASGGPVEMSEAEWRIGLDLNLTAAFLACKAVLPVMIAQGGGAIVHVGSIVGAQYPGTAAIAYQTAKAGLAQLSRSVALQYARDGIRSNCVLPGYVDTPEIRRRVEQRYGADLVENVMADRADRVPQGRAGTAWDIAYAALYLASDEAGHITGTELVVDGGASGVCLGSYGPTAVPFHPTVKSFKG
jgi:NAD(P)-dependent dehydrogenase (short-subunit alcohol dehydrogenase family)